MLTVLFNAILGVGVVALLGVTDTSNWVWATVFGVLAFILGQGVSGFLIQRQVKAAMLGVQNILVEGQKRLQNRINQWQMHPPGSVKQEQLEIEREQRVFVKQALDASQGLERFNLWAPLMGRQICTLRAQLYWMIKEFNQVDALLPKALMIDPMMAAIKLARMHMRGEIEGQKKFFQKQSRRLRYGQGVLLYALYAWILVQRKEISEAYKILIAAGEKMENETLKRNREHLANNRIGHFSNAGLGDEWFALHLEQPKVKTQRQRFNGRPF